MKSLQLLIPSLPDRFAMFNALCNHLNAQIGERQVSLLTDSRGKHLSIGAKRNEMLKAATADYIAFIDDDDMVSHNYIEKIYEAIQTEPDVVGLEGIITVDRMNPQTWSISKKYEWAEDRDGFKYVRYPNHLAPTKREIALAAGFKDMGHGEDYDYSMRLKEQGLIQTEFYIAENLYQYHYRTRK